MLGSRCKFLWLAVACTLLLGPRPVPAEQGNTQVLGGRTLKSSDFMPPEKCAECHSAIYQQWDGSMHSRAYEDPVFQKLWQLGNKETSGFTNKFCVACHALIGVVTGEFDEGQELSAIAQKGVQCDICHSIVGTNYQDSEIGEPHNASITIDPGATKQGPFGGAQGSYHNSKYSELHTKSELCANCHSVFHPLTSVPIERTYDEWRSSVYSQAGIQCQDCHMVPVELAIETAKTLTKQKNPGRAADKGPLRDHIYTHEFVGANTVVTTMLGSQRHAEIATKRLVNVAKLTLEPMLTVSGFGSFNAQVTNEGAGHNLPTGMTEIRQMWLQATVVDQNGRTVFSSGVPDAQGNLPEGTEIFDAKAVDKDGNKTYKPWDIVRFEYNKTIPPKATSVRHYAFPMPAETTEITIVLSLRYRSYSQQMINELMGTERFEVPIVDMNRQEARVLVAEVVTGAVAHSVEPASKAPQVGLDYHPLFDKLCSQCHTLERPRSMQRSAAKWRVTLTRMQGYSRYSGSPISDSQLDEIFRYLTTYFSTPE